MTTPAQLLKQVSSPASYLGSQIDATCSRLSGACSYRDGTDRQTDGRTPDRYINPAPHTMRAASRELFIDEDIENSAKTQSNIFIMEQSKLCD